MKILLLIILALSLTGCTPQVEYVEVPPETVTETITAPPVTETVTITETPAPVTITPPPVTVTVNQTIEVIVCTDNLTKWRSQDEVRQYVKGTGIPDRMYVVKDYDCEDFAKDLHIQALKDGYNIGLLTTIVSDERGQIKRAHMMNFVIVGPYLYEVEPQTGNLNPISWRI